MSDFLTAIKYRKTEIIVLLILVFEFIFPHYTVFAQEPESVVFLDFVIKSAEVREINSIQPQGSEKVFLIEPTKVYSVAKTYQIPITAYSSTADQCDSTPCITANGFNLCQHDQEDVIASNFLPFGTKVRIPEYFGDRIFTVQDRMNARYYYRADVWMKTRQAARDFGLVYATVEVLE